MIEKQELNNTSNVFTYVSFKFGKFSKENVRLEWLTFLLFVEKNDPLKTKEL